ncbi:MAG: S-adenosylmethionine synthetase [Zestosphaera tikiterensis]|uniref:S-adenosylmethionine synthase n=1 Tax=Zestosphaera tikiterensis TaxID=1973259 RepID=A0A2R7Y7I8_9CREN|nr:MAG: S-adenosylmethionine synthetase [Zestosphaera tikiterensis]
MDVVNVRNIEVEFINWTPVEEQKVELVERKGLGHPDYIADAASELSSVALSKYYLREYGYILHHNVDKVLLVGGQSKPVFGGGEVLHPIYIVVAGRATEFVTREGGRIDRIPVGTIIVNAVKSWIAQNFRFLDPERHLIIDYMVRPGSQDLVGVFELGKSGKPLSNDTSIGVSYAPLSTLEKLVFNVERFLNSREFKERIPEVGEDVKVMGLREGNKIRLTIAAAMISHLIPDVDHYISVKEEVLNKVQDLAVKIAPNHEVEVYLNTADVPEKGIVYLTVTGTSAEHGDDGMTGRGNRVNGLITPMRPMSLEATAGKNPVSHVGKIYNVLAMKIAERIVNEVPKVREVYVKLLSRIGHPIDRPQVALARILPEDNSSPSLNAIMSDVKSIMNDELERITDLTKLIIEGKVLLF